MSSVYILCGENLFLKQKRIDELRKKILNIEAAVLNYEVYEAFADDINPLKESLQSPSLLGQKLIVVHNADRLNIQCLGEILSLAQKNKLATLVLNSDNKDFAKQLHPSYHLNIEVFGKIYLNKIPSWLKQRAREKGVHLSTDAAGSLAQNLGDDLQLLDSTLDVLINFVDKKRKIDKEDVEELAGVNLDKNVFNLIDAVVEKNGRGALKLTDGILKAGQWPHQVLGVLAWHFTRILIARKILEERENFEGQRKIQQVFSLKNFFLQKFMRQVNAFTLERLKNSLDILLEADFNLKTLSAKPQYILEIALINLCDL
jgi:DNA polymerase-3 subunit delta